MKKTLLWLVCMVFLAACSQTEIEQVENTRPNSLLRTIHVNATLQGETRAEVPEELKYGFYLYIVPNGTEADYAWGGQYLMKYENDAWTFKQISLASAEYITVYPQWPESGTLHFYAWQDSGDSGNESFSGNPDYLDVAGVYYDLIVASEKNRSSGAVSLSFQHIMSKVEIELLPPDNDTEHLYWMNKIVVIANASGKYQYSTNTWSDTKTWSNGIDIIVDDCTSRTPGSVTFPGLPTPTTLYFTQVTNPVVSLPCATLIPGDGFKFMVDYVVTDLANNVVTTYLGGDAKSAVVTSELDLGKTMKLTVKLPQEG